MSKTSESDSCDILVVGGGIVGLATARALCAKGRSRIIVLEAEPEVARHQSGRNSGVMHAGVYYRPGSSKALLCTEGREALNRYCEGKGIPRKRCGKLVVASSLSEIPALAELDRRSRANGLKGLRRLSAAEIRDHEPGVVGEEGLWVPATGVVDFKKVTRALATDLTAAGGELRPNARVHALHVSEAEVVVESRQGAFRCRRLVNCAGLESDRVARLAGLDSDLRIVPFRGEYYSLRGASKDLVQGLVYPVPNPKMPFLGVHFTRTIDGSVLIGPNAVPALSRYGYRRRDVSLRDTAEILTSPGTWRLAKRLWRSGASELKRAFSRTAFIAEARKLVPGILEDDLEEAPSGVRAQAVSSRGELVDDFRFAALGRTFHVLNAPSPAATAALALGKRIADQVLMAGRLA